MHPVILALLLAIGSTPPPDLAPDGPYAVGALRTVNGIAFHPDGERVFLTHHVEDEERRGRPRTRIVVQRRTASGWGPPRHVSFAGAYTDYQPVLSPDGDRLYFTSTRPRPGTSEEARQDPWMVTATDDGWSDPVHLAALAGPGWDGHVTVTREGVAYVATDRPGGAGGVDVWRSVPGPDGSPGPPEPVEVINTPDGESDLFVDPDETVLFFTRWVDRDRSLRLWVSRRVDERWTAPTPVPVGAEGGWVLSPTLPPSRKSLLWQEDGHLQRRSWPELSARMGLVDPRDP